MLVTFNKRTFLFCSKVFVLFFGVFCIAEASAEDQIINAGTEVNNATGTWENSLKIYGTSQGAIIDGGDWHEVFAGGVAKQTQINNYGKLTVYSGAKAEETSLNLGNLYVRYNGTIENTTVNGGWLDVYDGGKAFQTTVNNGGNFYAQNGSYTKDIVVNSGGGFNGYDGSVVEGLTLNEGAKFNLGTNMTLINSSQNGNEIYIKDNIAHGFVVGNESQLNIASGATAQNIVVNNGGFLSGAENSYMNNVVINEGGKFNFNTDMTITNSVMFDQAFSLKNKVANNLLLNSGSSFNALSGGKVNNAIINDGGSLVINNGAKASNLIVNNGGFVSTSENSVINGLQVAENGKFFLNTAMTLTNATQNGNNVSIIDNVVKGFTLNYDQNLYISPNTSFIDTIVNGVSVYLTNNSSSQNLLLNDGTVEISSGGSALNTTVNSGTVKVYSDGTVDGITVNNGVLEAHHGSFVDNATIMAGALNLYGGNAKNVVHYSGNLRLYDGGILSNSTVKGGWFDVYSGSTANSVIIDGGEMYVQDRGVANKSILMSGLAMVLGGGNANGTDVRGGNFTITSGANASLTTVNGGNATVESGGMIINSTINSGTLNVLAGGAGGIAKSTTVNGGVFNVLGTAVGTDVKSGGLIVANGGAAITNLVVNDGGKADISTNVAQFNANLLGEDVNISGNVADGITLKEGITLRTQNEGVAQNITVDNGGALVVENGTVASSEINSGGLFVANSGTTTTGLIIEDGAKFDISTDVNQLTANVFGQDIAITGNSVDGLTVNDGSVLRIKNAGTATNTEVNSGGLFVADSGSTITNLIIEDGANFDISTDVNQLTANVFGQDIAITGNSVDGLTVNDGSVLRIKNAGTATNTEVDSGGLIVANSGSTVTGLIINEGGNFDISTDVNQLTANIFGQDITIAGNTVEGLTVNDGSVLRAENAGTANNINVSGGGSLIATGNSTLNSLTADKNANLNLADGTVLTGDIVINKDTNTSGSSYNFSNMFASSNLDINSLTVVGGVNEAFANKLINEDISKNKSLTLEGGIYSLANVDKSGTTLVAGWDAINIKATESSPTTVVKLESDIELVGSNKLLSVGDGVILDVSGHSPLEITIDGNVTNSGTLDFTTYDNDGEADDTITITGDYNATSGALMILNVEPQKNLADKIVVQGDVIGNTSLFLKSNSTVSPTTDVLFAEATNDKETTDSSFDIWRVEGSPFVWNTKKEDNKWYTFVESQGKSSNVVPEMIAYMGLYDVGFEQTGELNRVVASKTEAAKFGRQAWVSPVHHNLEIKSPYKYEAKISGLDAGIDVESDSFNKWGVLASYRQGNYEFDGKGERYYSEKASEVDIDSYLLGLYFRRDKCNTKLVASIYGGIQRADIASADGVKAKTEALELGATLDMAHMYRLSKGLFMTPEIQISYQMLDFDSFKDNAGKTIQTEAAHRITAEAGIKLENKWALGKDITTIYVKPSIIQNIHSGGKLSVGQFKTVHTTEDRTLGRLEIGAEFELANQWSMGADIAHTFGSDYNDTAFSLNIKYSF